MSSAAHQLSADLRVVVDGRDGDAGIPSGAELRTFAKAVLSRSPDVGPARNAVAACLGPAAAGDAAAVVAQFDAINRIADATGTPLDFGGAMESILEAAGVDLSRMRYEETEQASEAAPGK